MTSIAKICGKHGAYVSDNDDCPMCRHSTYVALSVTPDPADGPQLWYTDGHFAHRLDEDDADNVPNPTRRDIKLMRATVELALSRVAELERECQKQELMRNRPLYPEYMPNMPTSPPF